MKLELEKTEVEAILNLLAQAPYGQVAALITKISNQAQKQIDQIPKVEKVK